MKQYFGQATWLAQAVIACAAALSSMTVQAETTCEPIDARGVQLCKAGLSEAQAKDMLRTQEKPQWCWAASIAMVFAHQGVTLSQEQIVRRQYADLADRGVTGTQISRMLGLSWGDGAGGRLSPIAMDADADAHRAELGADEVVQELSQDRPLIFGTEGHAMVLVQVNFEKHGAALRITGATVIDPAPGKGLRKLLRNEMRPHYMAAVQLVPHAQVAAVSLQAAH